jgi:hypothetical protein
VVVDAVGVHHADRQVLAGEASSTGQIVLSWENVLAGAADPDDGRNVVIHEFAHRLDQEGGAANGAPLLGSGASYGEWTRAFAPAFAGLQHAQASGNPGDRVLDGYGAVSPAEFFAVASEAFFERPQDLQARHPAVYGQLSRYYRLDPAGW